MQNTRIKKQDLKEITNKTETMENISPTKIMIKHIQNLNVEGL